MVLPLGMLIESILATKCLFASDTLYVRATLYLMTITHILEPKHTTTHLTGVLLNAMDRVIVLG